MTTGDNYLEIYQSLDFDKIIDHPNILIAANFWEEERFLAAKACYKLMRSIDDLVDNYKSEHAFISEEDKISLITNVEQWIGSIRGKTCTGPFQQELADTFEKFRIPFWTMESFAKAMVYDICSNGFPSLEKFLDYSKGASVAPASVFVHLCGISRNGSNYNDPVYNVRRAATPCAIFSYIVHIIRDFQKDQKNNLNYFADDLVMKHGLSRKDLYEMAHGREISAGFRSLIREYYILADQYRLKTMQMIKELRPLLEPRYRLSLDIIFNLYLMAFERIDIEKGDFSTGELNPGAGEIRERVYRTICGFREVNKKHYVST